MICSKFIGSCQLLYFLSSVQQTKSVWYISFSYARYYIKQNISGILLIYGLKSISHQFFNGVMGPETLTVNLNSVRFSLHCFSPHKNLIQINLDKLPTEYPRGPPVIRLLQHFESRHWWSKPKCYCCCQLKPRFSLHFSNSKTQHTEYIRVFQFEWGTFRVTWSTNGFMLTNNQRASVQTQNYFHTFMCDGNRLI